VLDLLFFAILSGEFEDGIRAGDGASVGWQRTTNPNGSQGLTLWRAVLWKRILECATAAFSERIRFARHQQCHEEAAEFMLLATESIRSITLQPSAVPVLLGPFPKLAQQWREAPHPGL
jgi:hypothetical protein